MSDYDYDAKMSALFGIEPQETSPPKEERSHMLEMLFGTDGSINFYLAHTRFYRAQSQRFRRFR